MPITFKRAGQEAVTLENVSFKGVALDKVTFKRAGQEAITVFEKITSSKVTLKFTSYVYTSPEPCRGNVYYSLDNGTTWIDVLESNTGTTFVDIVLDDVKQIKFKCIADGSTYGSIESGTGSLAGINIYTSGHETKISDNYVITQDSAVNVLYSD